MFVAGVDVTALALANPPFTTLYLRGGEQPRERAHLALDRAGAPNLHPLLDAIGGDEVFESRVIIAAGDAPVEVFEIDEPLRFDVARSGQVLSLGTLIEYSQFSSPHAVVTIEDDVFAITSFGSIEVPDPVIGPVSVSESILTAIEALGFVEPQVLALVGSKRQLEKYSPTIREAFPVAWVQHYTTDDIDEQLTEISDQIVRDAQSRSAESLTNDLAQFRAARDLGRTVEGAAVVEAIREAKVASVLVHDDPNDLTLLEGDRLVDHVTHLAVAHRVPIRMIPNVDAVMGPAEGLGAVLYEPSMLLAAAMPSTVTSSVERSPSVAS